MRTLFIYWLFLSLSLKKQNDILSKLTVANRRKEIFDMIKAGKVNLNDMIIKKGNVVHRPVPTVVEETTPLPPPPEVVVPDGPIQQVMLPPIPGINVTLKKRGPRKPYGPRDKTKTKLPPSNSERREYGYYTKLLRFMRLRDTRYIKGSIYTVAAGARTASKNLGFEFKCEDIGAGNVSITRTK